jgi:hypothetical protein
MNLLKIIHLAKRFEIFKVLQNKMAQKGISNEQH